MDMDQVAAKLRERVAGSGFEKSIKFDLGDETLVVDGETVSREDQPTDCTITMTRGDFASLIAGELNPTAAFMQGKLKVAGDMSVAMQLSQML